MKRLLFVLTALMLISAPCWAVTYTNTNLANQTSATVADSMSAAADTTAAYKVPINISNFFVTTTADSNAIRKVQVNLTTDSFSSTKWRTVVMDTVVTVTADTGGKARTTADLASTFRNCYVRVIVDRLKSAAGYGRSWVSIGK